MPIAPPRLDDLTYDRVVDDLVRRIPVYAPQWTDFNASDPGITLIQLLAQLAEQLGWRLNQLPESAHIQLLKLLGVTLAPATAARTQLALLLANPATATAFTLAAGVQAAAKLGSPPPIFSTLIATDIVPAQMGVLISTRNPLLYDVRKATENATTDEALATPLDPAAFPADDSEWLSLRWDGKKPKDKDLPTQPLVLLPAQAPPHRFLWAGVQFNAAPDAGFLGTRVTLHLQLDDDEQPTRTAIGACGPAAPVGEVPPVIDWLHYYDAATRRMRPITGRIDDSTQHLTRSGTIRFAVPSTLGAIADADWQPLQRAGTMTPIDACLTFAGSLGDTLGNVQVIAEAVKKIGDDYRARLNTELDRVWAADPPAAAIDALIGVFKTALAAALNRTWPTPPPLADIQAFYLTEARHRLDNLVLPNGLNDVIGLIRTEVDHVLTGNNGWLILIPLPPAVVAAVSLLLGNYSWSTLAQNIHAWFISQAKSNLDTLWAGLHAPNQLIADLAAWYMDQLRPVVDGLWSLPAVDTARAALAQHYRGLVDQAVATVWAQQPTAAIAALADQYRDAVDGATTAVTTAAGQLKPYVAHPLAAKNRGADKVSGWLRLTVPSAWTASGTAASSKLRHLGFNVVTAEHADTVTGEVLGAATGEPGQASTLRHGNVLDGTLRLAVQEDADRSVPLTPWQMVATLDDQDPFARVFVCDREAGTITFGDGTHGRIPALVPGGGLIVAQTYRHGGGLSGEVDVGAISALKNAPAAISAAVNIVAARGGHDAEQLPAAKIRARKELSTRSRAVVADDFVWFAQQTPTVRVGRALCVPLRRALAAPGQGLDTVVAPGAVAVVVVPDQRDVPEPLPTRSFLRAVCAQLDRYRLVTTELHVVPPQYCRLFNISVRVVAKPGYTRTQLQDLVEARLRSYLHPLTGGDDGTGFPFGSQLHSAELLALILRVDGIDRVDALACTFVRSATNVSPRQGRLVLCPAQAGDTDHIDLAPEECASVDVSTLTLTTVV